MWYKQQENRTTYALRHMEITREKNISVCISPPFPDVLGDWNAKGLDKND